VIGGRGRLRPRPWWGEAPERPPVPPGKLADTISVVGWAWKRAEPWSIACPRLGAFIGLTHCINWYPPIHPGSTGSLSGASPHQVLGVVPREWEVIGALFVGDPAVANRDQ
jgi:hypothetical protein